jgi:hypothetical protein
MLHVLGAPSHLQLKIDTQKSQQNRMVNQRIHRQQEKQESQRNSWALNLDIGSVLKGLQRCGSSLAKAV